MVDTSAETTEGMTANYTCDTGYTLSGMETRTCGADGVWSPTEPTCQIMPASRPVISVIATTTTLNYFWTQSQREIVDNYSIIFSYTGDCQDIQDSFPEMTFVHLLSELLIESLEEFSNYSLSVAATNRAGTSAASTLVTSTLPTAPSVMVTGLMASATADSVTLQWERVPCRDRNTEITGYLVIFGSTTIPISGTVMRNYTVTGLIPRTQHSYEVVPVSGSEMGPGSVGTVETLLPDMPIYQLNGTFYSSHGLVTLENIGSTDSTALLCITDTMTCCEPQSTGTTSLQGRWILPNGTTPDFPRTQTSQYYMSFGPSVVRLHRTELATSRPAGIYRCEIPNVSSNTQTLYIGVYPADQGTPSIEGDFLFDRSSLTLTCVSTGGPVSKVEWTRNGVPVSTGYILSQTVNDTGTGRYENVLRSAIIADLVGNFSCTVRNSRGSDTAEIVLNGIQIMGDVPSFTVGGVATLSCVSDSDAVMIEWLDGNLTQVAMTTSGRTLNHTISPVTDDLQGAEFICRVIRTEDSGEQSIRLSVIVPSGAIFIAISVEGSPTAGEVYTVSCGVREEIAGLTRDPVAVWMDSDGPVMTGNDVIVTSSGNVTTIEFNPLRASHAQAYRCEGRLESPALVEPLSVEESRIVAVTIPTPGVTVTPPASPLTAGTPLTLICSITVVIAVDINVLVDVTWVVAMDADSTNTSSVATGTVPTFNHSLTIPILSTSLTGVTCRASVRRPSPDPFINPSAEESAPVDLSVHAPPPPIVWVNVTGDSVAGSTLSLLCTASPPIPLVSPPVVSWVGVVNTDDVTVTSSMLGSGSSVTVTFDPLKTSHGWVYQCQADYDIPQANLPPLLTTGSTAVTVQIPRPEATVTPNPPAETYTVGLSVDLVCEVTLSPSVDSPLTLNPVWTRDGAPLTVGNQVSIVPFTMSSSSQFSSSLRFSPLTRKFIGNGTVFECEVTVSPLNDTYITATTITANTTITVEDTDFNALLSGAATITAGSPHSLMCQGTRDSSLPNATLEVEWFSGDGSPVPSGVSVVGETSTTESTLVSTLAFLSLTTSQAGEYTCRVNLTIPGTTITDQSVERRVKLRVQIPSPQVVVSASRSAPLYEGTTGLVISCEVTPDSTGVDTDTVVTRGITGPVPADGGRVSTSDSGDESVIRVEWTIRVLSLNDSGEYNCDVAVASDLSSEYIIEATVTMSMVISVSALPPPEVTITAQPLPPISAGDSLTLTCSVIVIPHLASPPTVQWTRSSGQALSNSNSGLNHTLTFDPVSTSAADQYTCTASFNIADVGIVDHSSVESVNLTVTVPSPIVAVTTPEPEPVYHGTNHTLSCVASYDSTIVDSPVTLEFAWTGPGGVALVNSDFIVISRASSESALTLTPVDQPTNSTGKYTCTVTVHSEDTLILSGSSSDSVSLNVLAAPAPLVESGVPVRSGRCGEVVSITCFASVLDNFFTRPVIIWQGPGGQTVDSDEILNTGLSSPGEYTCEACVTVEVVGIVDLCNTTTVTLTSEDTLEVTDLSCLSSKSSDILEVVWTPPTDHPVLSYQVEVSQYVEQGGQVVTTSIQDRQVVSEGEKVIGLAPAVRYLVLVQAGGGSGCGPAVMVECYTEEGPPPVVTGVGVERLNGTVMNVSWTPPNKAVAGGFIQSYTITYTVSTGGRTKRQTNTVEVPANRISEVVGGLNPPSQYDVTVMAESGGGVSQVSAVVGSGETPTSGTGSPPTITIVVSVVAVLLVVLVLGLIVAILVLRIRRDQLVVDKMSRREPSPIIQTGVVSTGQYEVMEMGDKHEDSIVQRRGSYQVIANATALQDDNVSTVRISLTQLSTHSKSRLPPASQPSHSPPASQPSQPPPASQPSHPPPASQPSQPPPEAASQPSQPPPASQPSHRPPASQPFHSPPTSQAEAISTQEGKECAAKETHTSLAAPATDGN